MIEHPTKIIGTCIELTTAIIGLSVYKKAGIPFRLLTFLLVYGFFTDAFCWMFYKSFPKQGELALDIYSLTESVAFLFIIQVGNYINKFNNHFKWFYVAMLFLFIMSYYCFPHLLQSEKIFSGFFSFVYIGTASVFAALSMLKLIEKGENNFYSPHLQLVTGIFVYCFCSFLVDTFIDDEIKEKIWWVHDVMNILAYLLFSTAFLTLKKQNK